MRCYNNKTSITSNNISYFLIPRFCLMQYMLLDIDFIIVSFNCCVLLCASVYKVIIQVLIYIVNQKVLRIFR